MPAMTEIIKTDYRILAQGRRHTVTFCYTADGFIKASARVGGKSYTGEPRAKAYPEHALGALLMAVKVDHPSAVMA